jgi:hypothetical protein
MARGERREARGERREERGEKQGWENECFNDQVNAVMTLTRESSAWE